MIFYKVKYQNTKRQGRAKIRQKMRRLCYIHNEVKRKTYTLDISTPYLYMDCIKCNPDLSFLIDNVEQQIENGAAIFIMNYNYDDDIYTFYN